MSDKNCAGCFGAAMGDCAGCEERKEKHMNQAGYADPTAEQAIGHVERQKRKECPKELKEMRKTFEYLARQQGYRIKEIVFQDKASGKIYTETRQDK